MGSEERVTLLRPPEPDPSKAQIENVVEVTKLGVLGPDIFTNTRKPWRPQGARGVFGGAVIAQSLASAQRTVPDDFLVHSCHCYFLLAGADSIPILYHVERVRDGKSFATRTVQARQKGRCIFTTTISFAKEGSGGAKQVRHAKAPPEGIDGAPEDDWKDEPEWQRSSPTQSQSFQMYRGDDPTARPDERKCRQWMRARPQISPEGGHQAHLNALAYMSDNYFIGTVSRIHGLWRFPFEADDVATLPEPQRRRVLQAMEFDGMGTDPEGWRGRAKVGMVVSLDHSIYFHEPKRVRADEWMFVEMESPWSGEGRGVVMQRIFAKDGTLLASCVQEGVVRLQQDDTPKL